jgi:hypothetical protein
MSQIGNNIGKVAGQMSQQAAPILDQLMDKLTGRHASITYTFENFTIDMPKAQGPQGQQMMSGKISIRGSLTISAELHKTNNDTNQIKIGDEMKNVNGISGNNNNNSISSDIGDNTTIPTTTMSTPMVDSSNPTSI